MKYKSLYLEELLEKGIITYYDIEILAGDNRRIFVHHTLNSVDYGTCVVVDINELCSPSIKRKIKDKMIENYKNFIKYEED